ncbi:MAG: sugar ABC transporter permease [Chloroflexi bacterium RBG_16_72_14]|nr:MAG: sugar ABC transporter permease [Chloroflexi bacterium RBG_16_72_14]
MTTVTAATQARAERDRLPGFVRRLPLHLFILFLIVVWLVPTIGLLVNSFRPPEALTQSGWWTAFFSPSQFTLDNYAHVLAQSNISEGFVNSLFISIPATVIPIMVAAFAAYAFAWMEFPGRNLLFIAVVGLLVVPLQSTFIPILQLYGPNGFGIAGSFLAVWLAHTGYGLPFAVFLLRNFMGDLPREVFESAAIDGASPVTAFFRLALPMTVPAIAALAIFQFLFVWNDLLVALIYLGAQNPDNAPLTIAVSNLVSSLGGGWQYLAAAAFVTMAVPLAVFLGLQRYFVRGIVGGSVKG